MAIAFDAASTASVSSGGGSFNHTPVGTPRAILVFAVVITTGDGSSDLLGGVTYGGVAMTEVTGSPHAKATGEDSIVYAYFLGADVPTGEQSCAVTGTSGQTYRVTCLSYTAAEDCEVAAVNTSISSDSVENPTSTLALSGETCAVAQGFMSGQGNTGNVNPLTDWTSQSEASAGFFVGGCYTYDIVGSTDVTIGLTQAADDALVLAVAIKEASAAVTVTPDTLALTITEQTPSVILGTVVTPAIEELAITAFAPSVTQIIRATPATLALTITTYHPDITAETLDADLPAPVVTPTEILSAPRGSGTKPFPAPRARI